MKKLLTGNVLLGLITAGAMTTGAQADVIALYNMEGANAFEDSAGVLNASDITGAITQANSIPGLDYFNDTLGGVHQVVLNGGTTTDTVSWTTVGSSGESITYESLSVFFGSNSAAIAPALSYVIGAGSPVAAGAPGAPALQTFTDHDFDFADFSTDQTVTWTITFTLQSGSNDRMRFDDLTLNGTVVPEPGSLALLGLGGLLIARRRRGNV